MKKILSLILSVVIVSSLFVTTAFAATGNVSFTVSDDDLKVKKGDTFDVTVASAQKEIVSDSFWLDYDENVLKVVTLKDDWDYEGADALFSLTYNFRGTQTKNFDVGRDNGSQCSWGFASTTKYTYDAKDKFAVITFEVISDDVESTTLTLEEDTYDPDLLPANGYKGIAQTTTLTIAKDAPAEPVVGTPSTVEKAKTWNVTIAGGYVTATDTLTATLYDTTNESDKQDVTLSIGSGVIEGELGWSFSLKANFNDADKMGDIGLKVAKN